MYWAGNVFVNLYWYIIHVYICTKGSFEMRLNNLCSLDVHPPRTDSVAEQREEMPGVNREVEDRAGVDDVRRTGI